MKKILLLLALACCTFVAEAQQKIKVACIGNSITFGRGLGDSTYPAHLQRLLGDGYEVRNYGVSGRTLLKKGDKPYWAEAAFTEAKAWAPDIVVIKLGTNDSKPRNWDANKADFVPDYKAFIAEWKALPSHPKVYLCYPVPVWDNTFTIRESVVKGEIIPALKKIAKQEKLPVIDLYKALKPYQSYFKDGVHPNRLGAVKIAEAVEKKIGAKKK
ncbi:GDSL-type esterase/lipase family protein [Chitinophaga lutea]